MVSLLWWGCVCQMSFCCKTYLKQWKCPLQWRHNERHGVSNHWRLHCLLNCWPRSKKTSKPRVTGPFAGNSLVTGEFPAQKASNAENVSILMTSSWSHWSQGLKAVTSTAFNTFSNDQAVSVTTIPAQKLFTLWVRVPYMYTRPKPGHLCRPTYRGWLGT